MIHIYSFRKSYLVYVWYVCIDDIPLDRCGDKQSGTLGTASEATDGILGFGQSNSSVISQLAASGKVKKVFAHCLDNVIGGGIFTIGQVVQPKVNTTPLVPNQYVYPPSLFST